MLQFEIELNNIIAMNDGVSLKYMFTDALGSAAADYDTYGNREDSSIGAPKKN